MQNRLQQFLQAENITPARFADQIGIQRSGVSHILSGRNKPGFDFIEKMLRCYPSLNAEWIITGKGKMYKEIRTASLFDEASATPPATTLVAPSAQTAAPIVSADQDSEESATEHLTEKQDLNVYLRNQYFIICIVYSDPCFFCFLQKLHTSLLLNCLV